MPNPLTLTARRAGSGPGRDRLLEQAQAAAGNLDGALEVARTATRVAPLPGSGETAHRWELLAGLAAADLTVARLVEAHLDAVAILAEAGAELTGAAPGRRSTTWGVFAAESPDSTLEAVPEPSSGPAGSNWRLTGTKPWCSAAAVLDRALVTARTPDGRRLFQLDLRVPGVTVEPPGWVSRGLAAVPSGPIRLDDVPATPVGPIGWYVDRPGLGWGGMGVAACWYGGAVGVARRLWRAAEERPPDDVALLHLGAVDSVLHATRCVLADAAAAVDDGSAVGPAGRLQAQRVRAQAARCVDEVLTRTGHGLGPGPLTREEEHARRVADLQVYVRQQHAERDDRSTGALLREIGEQPW